MKKNYISLSVAITLAFASKGFAQAAITLSSTYLPQVGSTYNMVADSMPADMAAFTVSAGSSTAQTWSYTTGFNTTYNAAESFVAPTGNPGAASFPSATLASNQGSGTWGYLTNASNGLYLIGADVTASGVAVAIPFSPSAPEIPTPFTYGNTTGLVVYTGTASATVSGIPVVIKHRAFRTVTADAFGTITTPAGTYSNTLRIYTHETYSDSIFTNVLGSLSFYEALYDTTINYRWYQNATNALVVSLDQKTSGATKDIQYLQGSTAGINTVKQSVLSTNLYPNPTSGITYLSYENQSSANVNASIYDITGRQVATLVNNQPQAAGKQVLTIDVNNLQLPQGLYMVQLTVNGAMKTIKLNVQ
jgi:hypothetical protein